MGRVQKADLAGGLGLSRAAVSMAVKRGQLTPEADGSIDTEREENRAWIGRTHQRSAAAPEAKEAPKRKRKKAQPAEKPSAPTEPKKPKQDTVSTPANKAPPASPGIDAGLEIIIQDADEKRKLTRARRQLAEAETHLKDLNAGRIKALLIPREEVRKAWSSWDVGLKTAFRDFGRRHSAQIHALATQGAREVEAYLEREIAAALGRAKDEAKKQGGA